MIYNKFYLNNKEITNEQYVNIAQSGNLYQYDLVEKEPDEVHLTYNDIKAKQYELENDKQRKIAEAQSELNATDYKAIKYAEGHYTEKEYAPIKAARQILRDKINELREQSMA